MKINPYIFRAYDIRGIADASTGKPIDLTEESVYLIGKASGTYLQKKYKAKTIIVGRDNRLSSEKLKTALIKGLSETGLNITDIGPAISPMIYWAVCAMKFDAGIILTASHNSKEYNGVKIVSENAHSICGDELQEILKIIQNEKFKEERTKGSIANLDVWPKYLEDICSRVKTRRKLKIVVDAGNGTAGKFAPELLRKLGCKVVELYCNLDGTFPNHEPNPEEPANMKDLISKVLKENADLGIGFDGDGDRIGIIDEKGRQYSSDYMLLLLARDLSLRIPGAQIVFDVKVSKVIINNMKQYGLIPIMSKTGHSFIEKKMKELKAPLGGEVSGHLFFAENYYGFDDAFLAAAKIIEILSSDDHTLSQLLADLPETFITPELKAGCPDEKKFEIIKKLTNHFTKLYDCLIIDGVRVNFDEKSWGAVRASNTSPNLTLRFEAPSEKRLKEIQKIMADELRKYPEVSLDWYSGLTPVTQN